MGVERDKDKNSKFRLEIIVPDSFHVSGGPFCCFVKLIPIYDVETKLNSTFTVDFVAINTYGVLIADDKAKVKSKIQTTLRFPFLLEESSKLSQNQNVFLIYSSDSVLFCTGKEINGQSKELSYQYRCKIPPFIPPSLKGSSASINYYVYVTVQYRNSSDPKHQYSISERLEFVVLGSIYHDFPILDIKYYPILPKIGESTRDFYRDCKSIISNNYGTDNMLFNYESSLVNLLESEEDLSEPKELSIQLYRDLNTFLVLWDSISDLENLDGIAYINVLHCFNSIVADFTNLAKTGDIHRIEKLKEWFGDILNPELYGKGDSASAENIDEALNMFLEKLEVKTCCLYDTSLETMKSLVSCSFKERNRVEGEEALKFSCEGNKLCVCHISGFSRIEDSEDMDFTTNSWFELRFDFSESKRHCLKVDISFVRTDVLMDATPRRHHVITNQLITLGKTTSTITSFIPKDTIPTFSCAFIDVSYRLEITFFCFEDNVNIMERDSIKAGLNKLKLVRWEKPIRILQNQLLGINARDRNFNHTKTSRGIPPGIKKSCIHFCGRQIPLYKTIEM
ncbi:hypothetical protein BEWA_032040 [Theileria equi strain WA]|uniref:Uncharacterized protein n=1 Tax=Theileria equi strain WA TaxID=1537102 RepID=L0AZA9_THEEQ|nr:hypothetical protein BEWA_032040 [Theileria equi strain WA]AFZ80351.1 hypothetical protein BEWA_032040 [Theileria equi strain WA]|eukprot:XP_004830017.1 hypothetical protein BEWA_032040 [Theileria equi strain WA]